MTNSQLDDYMDYHSCNHHVQNNVTTRLCIIQNKRSRDINNSNIVSTTTTTINNNNDNVAYFTRHCLLFDLNCCYYRCCCCCARPVQLVNNIEKESSISHSICHQYVSYKKAKKTITTSANYRFDKVKTICNCCKIKIQTNQIENKNKNKNTKVSYCNCHCQWKYFKSKQGTQLVKYFISWPNVLFKIFILTQLFTTINCLKLQHEDNYSSLHNIIINQSTNLIIDQTNHSISDSRQQASSSQQLAELYRQSNVDNNRKNDYHFYTKKTRPIRFGDLVLNEQEIVQFEIDNNNSTQTENNDRSLMRGVDANKSQTNDETEQKHINCFVTSPELIIANKLSKSSAVFLFILLIFINLSVIAGNILVILAVYATAKLQNVTNLFIVSLAASDLLLGIAVLPYSLLFEVSLVKSDIIKIFFDRKCLFL